MFANFASVELIELKERGRINVFNFEKHKIIYFLLIL